MKLEPPFLINCELCQKSLSIFNSVTIDELRQCKLDIKRCVYCKTYNFTEDEFTPHERCSNCGLDELEDICICYNCETPLESQEFDRQDVGLIESFFTNQNSLYTKSILIFLNDLLSPFCADPLIKVQDKEYVEGFKNLFHNDSYRVFPLHSSVTPSKVSYEVIWALKSGKWLKINVENQYLEVGPFIVPDQLKGFRILDIGFSESFSLGLRTYSSEFPF